MYLAVVVLLMLALPAASVVIEFATGADRAGFVFLVGKWFVFWAIGWRLLIAGIRQTANPAFTAAGIFGVTDPKARPMAQEIGFGNLAIGLLAVLTIFEPAWIVPAAIPGGLFFGLAALVHLAKRQRNANENIAMMSDFWAFLVTAAFLLATWLQPS